MTGIMNPLFSIIMTPMIGALTTVSFYSRVTKSPNIELGKNKNDYGGYEFCFGETKYAEWKLPYFSTDLTH